MPRYDSTVIAGYSPLLIGDADGLPELIRAEKPGLVLLDLMLPGSDGIELMRTIPELSDLPVIFISGYLLRMLSLNSGRVLTYGTLLRQVWRVRGDNDTARVRTFMMKLHRKLGDPVARSAYILNERGIGYRMPRPALPSP